MTDYCGQVGAKYTSLIIPFPPGALSSYSWDIPVGSTVSIQDNFFQAEFTKAVNVQDLACPTWGFASTRLAGRPVVGPPFNPLIEPPKQLLEFDPEWRKCTGFNTNGDFISSWAIQDPPYALTPQAGIGPVSFTSAAPEVTSTASPGHSGGSVATPAQSPSPIASPTASPSHVMPASTPGTLSTVDAEQPSRTPQPASAALGQSSLPLGQPQSGSSISAPDIQGQHSAVDPKASFTTVSDPKIGGIIYSAFGLAPTIVIDPPTDPATVLTVGGSVLTVYPSKSALGGTVLTLGGSVSTVAGTPVSIGPSGIVIGTSTMVISTSTGGGQDPGTPKSTVQPFTAVDGSAIAIGGSTLTAGGVAITASGKDYSVVPSGVIISPASRVSAEVFSFGSQTFTGNPTALVVAGSTLIAGAPAITIDGTNISLGPSGLAVIGSATVNLNLPVPSIVTIAGKSSTAYPSVLSIGGTTITAGGPGLTIQGTPVSLEPSGIVLFGTSTLNINSFLPTTTASDKIQPFLSAQSKVDSLSGIKLGLIFGGISLLMSWLTEIADGMGIPGR